MRFETFATLLNLAAVQATAIPAAFPEPGLQADSSASVSLGVPKMITPKYRSTAKRAIIRYPAFELSAKGKGHGVSMDPNGQGGTLRIGDGMCTRCTLLSAHYRLVHPDGREATPAEGVYIHHMTSFLSPKNSSSPIGGLKIGLGGANSAYFIDRGEDSGQSDTVFTSPDGKYNSGYQINSPRSPSITVSYDFVNYENSPKQLHLELEYEYVDGVVGQDAGHTLKSVSPIGIKLNGVTSSENMKVSRDTTIVWARGHLHSGGEKMTLKVNGATKCVSKPTYDSAGIITAMTLCPESIHLKAGDTLKIESLYDTAKHPLRKASDGSGHAAHGKFGGSDVMGMFAMSYTM